MKCIPVREEDDKLAFLIVLLEIKESENPERIVFGKKACFEQHIHFQSFISLSFKSNLIRF